ncbi:glycosyltransferase family 4 protein [Geotalea sp. SG265]|uniref:glycosyltransferase family 4 protein n=1 Tax=Geotalea sp. SG265 TaxID=2922867 RepID=UPI001FAF424F|nr:glycosyltransferase family 4 protein [Geotalea sp. SG265]
MKRPYHKIRPMIFWEGFPPCGLLTKRLTDAFGDDLKLLGTRAAVPFAGLDKYLTHPIRWLDVPNEIWNIREEYADRNFIIHTGWRYPGWLKFDRWMRSRGAKIVITLDNTPRWDMRQLFGSIWFRLWLRRHFDGAFVPGHASTRLLHYFGMPPERIFTGYYGAFEQIYYPGPPVSQRSKEFLFIGQLIHRKGVDIMLEGFRKYRATGGDWGLRIMGNGPLELMCHGEGITFEGFGQPEYCAERMRSARCLILMSREDHWGTVVCEAAACGTALLTSSKVGATEDIVRPNINGLVLHTMNPDEMCRKLQSISSWSARQLDYAGEVSCGISKGFDSQAYLVSVLNMMESLCPPMNNKG